MNLLGLTLPKYFKITFLFQSDIAIQFSLPNQADLFKFIGFNKLDP